MQHDRHHRRSTHRPARRGVAMLLVIVSLAMATILTTAYLASRDNSTAIGENVTSAATARWAAESALELATAVLETDSDWRTMHTNGMLFEYAPLAGALTSVELTDLETNLPPTDKTEQVFIRATAISGLITKVATAKAVVRTKEAEKTAQVDFSDFAMFAVNSAKMAEDAMLAPWATSPAASYAQRLNIGTRGTAMGTLNLQDNSRMLDTTVFHGPGVSVSYWQSSKEQYVEEVALPEHLPAPSPPSTGVSPPSGGLILDLLLPLTNLISSTKRYGNVTLSNAGTVLRLSGNTTLIAERNVTMSDNTGVQVQGPSKIVIFGDLIMRKNTYIELNPGATLDLFVFGTVTMDDAYIGGAGADRSNRPVDGTASWIDPHRIRIYTIPKVNSGDAVNTPTWWMVNKTVVKGNIYVPNAQIVMRNSASIYGRVSASTIEMRESTRVYYDQSLNRGMGFSNLKAPMYESDKTFKSAFKTYLNSLDGADLAALAASTGLLVKRDKETYGTLTPDADEPVAPGDPTPRTMNVEVMMSSVDLDMKSWENK